jgi:signal recognition particle receptor subunit beta
VAFFNYATMQMAAKIVYYGPGLCGKTTNLQYIYNKTSPGSRGEMVSLETESDRTLFFDLLPIEVGVIAGFKTRFQLYTVPGQVFYGETRRMVLKGVDGVVFVADSQTPMAEPNVESLKDLESNLRELGVSLGAIPMVLQYNKRDLPNILSVEALNKSLNWHNWEHCESSAVNGTGVFNTLKTISRLTLISLKTKLSKPEEPAVRVVSVAPPTHAAQVRPADSPKVAIPAIPIPKAAPRPSPPPVPEVEFATLKTFLSEQELAKTAPRVKTVSTSGTKVSQELDRIRESLLGPILSAPPKPKVKDLTPALDDLKKAAQAPAPPPPLPEVEIVVPREFLEELKAVQMDLLFLDGRKKRHLPGGIKIPAEELLALGDTRCVKLVFKPKKA